MNIFKDYIGRYPLSKTLRFELKPVGKTKEWIDERGLIQNDEERGQNYLEVKKMMDEYHKAFIDEVLSSGILQINWLPLCDFLTKYHDESDPSTKLELRNKIATEQTRLRKQVAACFTKSSEFKDRYALLFKEDMIKKVLPEYVSDQIDSQHKLECLQSFKGFTSYFVGFYDVRKNLYSDEEKSQTIAYRIVNENFTKFIDAIRTYKLACETYPEAIATAGENLGIDLDKVFEINSFNNYLSQSGISYFNDLIGGWVEEDGTKIQGLNECLNEAYQQHQRSLKRIAFNPLLKMILSDRESRSFYVEAFKDDRQMADAILDFAKSIRGSVNEETGEIINALSECVNITMNLERSAWENIFIRKQAYTSLSRKLFNGRWAVIDTCIENVRENKVGPCLGMNKKTANAWAKEYISQFVLYGDTRSGIFQSKMKKPDIVRAFFVCKISAQS